MAMMDVDDGPLPSLTPPLPQSHLDIFQTKSSAYPVLQNAPPSPNRNQRKTQTQPRSPPPPPSTKPWTKATIHER